MFDVPVSIYSHHNKICVILLSINISTHKALTDNENSAII